MLTSGVLPATVLKAVKSLNWRTLSGIRQESGQICVIEFDPSEFNPVLFQDVGILRPASIACSVLKRQAEFFSAGWQPDYRWRHWACLAAIFQSGPLDSRCGQRRLLAALRTARISLRQWRS